MHRFVKGYLLAGFVTATLATFILTGCGQQEEASSPAVRERVGETDLPKEDCPDSMAGPITEERTFYDFERGDLSGWEIPQWAAVKNDYVAVNVQVSDQYSSKGGHSMKVAADFPGGYWTAALVEIQQYLDLSSFRELSADVYIPEDAPVGLVASLIITIGDNWRFVEMNRSFPLIPGEWVTLRANIAPGSYDWKRIVPDEKFAQDVRKIAVRVESNNRPQYSGDIFIDNVRVGR